MKKIMLSKIEGRRSKSGSNLKGQPLRGHRSLLIAARRQALAPLDLAFRRGIKRLLTKADLQTASEIANQVRTEYRQAAMQLGGVGGKIDAARRAARRRLDRLLNRSVPKFRKLASLRREHQRTQDRLSGAILGGQPIADLQVTWGEAIPADPPPAKTYKAPYPLFDIQMIDDEHLVSENHSFATPSMGYLVNRFQLDDEEDTPVILGVYGMLPRKEVTSMVACGVRYTVPQTGRLRIGAVVNNYWSRVALSVSDNWGFSWAFLEVRVSLFVDVVRGAEVFHLGTVLVSGELRSDGDNESYLMPDLDNSLPFALAGTPLEPFGLGEELWIMVGAEVHVLGELDDMRSHVDATVGWGIQKITVQVV